MQLDGGIGRVGDVYERHADAVAEAVVSGRSAEPLLDRMSPATIGTPVSSAPSTQVPARVQRLFAGPAVLSGAGSGFDDFLLQFSGLEALATSDGYTQKQRVTAFRKIFYDSTGPATSYGGVTYGGGAWNVLIPGAAATALPPSWTDPSAASAVAYLRSHAVQTINGVQVDIGHLLTGADAHDYPTSISLPGVTMRSNLEATTFTGDLGSVVAEYTWRSTASFRDTAMVLDSSLMTSTYNALASLPDMAGDADAHSMAIDPAKSLTDNLRDYYIGATGGSRRRWKRFAAAIGLGSLATGTVYGVPVTTFPGNTSAWRGAMQGEIMEAALAYAAANGHRGDVINVTSDPGPGVFSPTFWEMYWNVSGWALDEFLFRLRAGAAAEP